MTKTTQGYALAAAILLGWLGTALGQDGPAAPSNPWSGEAELGVVTTGGNTKTRNINAKAAITHERVHWRHVLSAEALGSSDRDSTTAERYAAREKSDWKWSENNYLFITVAWEKDRFSGFDYRISEALGYGRRLIGRKTVTFDAEVGGGGRHSKLEATGDKDDEVMGRVAARLQWSLAEGSTFTEDATSEIGEESTISKSVTALKSQVAGDLATRISYTFKHTSDVPVGVKKSDWETAITLVYGF